MSFDEGQLRTFLKLMQEHGVASGSLDNFTFSFADVARSGREALATTPVIESREERLEKLKQDLLRANDEEIENENWSST